MGNERTEPLGNKKTGPQIVDMNYRWVSAIPYYMLYKYIPYTVTDPPPSNVNGAEQHMRAYLDDDKYYTHAVPMGITGCHLKYLRRLLSDFWLDVHMSVFRGLSIDQESTLCVSLSTFGFTLDMGSPTTIRLLPSSPLDCEKCWPRWPQ